MSARNLLLTFVGLFAEMFLINIPATAQISEAEKLYEQGVYQLEAVGNFEEAISFFNKVVAEYPADKQVAAKSLLKKGFCYERLGSQKATEAYEQIIDQYSDQVSLVTQAKDRLAALSKVVSTELSMSRLPTPDEYIECQTLSPDGTKLAGIGWSPGQNIAIYDLESGEMKYITHYDNSTSSCSTYGPVWSPDSREVVYWEWCWGGDPEEENYHLRITSLDGESSILTVNRDGGGIAACDWLPDKSAILAVVGKKEGQCKLVMISVGDGTMREICTLQRSYLAKDKFMAQASGSADLSPDGKYIAFADNLPGVEEDIYIVPVNGRQKTKLTDHPAADVEPRWSPDGKYIAFNSNRNGSWALWGVAMNEGRAVGQPYMILEGMQDKELDTWTQKGLCTRTMASASDIYMLDIDPETHEVLAPLRLLETKSYGTCSFPLWSPDGKYLVYRTYVASENALYLMIMPTDGGNVIKVKPEFAVSPVGGSMSWIPDGPAIGGVYWDKDISLYLDRIDPVSGEVQTSQIPAGDFKGHLMQLTWSGDAKSFFYSEISEDSKTVSFISHDIETGKEHNLFQYDRGDSVEWSWWKLGASGDRTRLAFGYHKKLGVINLITGDVQQIDYDPGKSFYSPTWSPDGNYLLVKGPHSAGDDINELYVVSIADWSYKSLNISQYLPKEARITVSHDWSPDGKTIVFDARTWKSEANLIQNVIQE